MTIYSHITNRYMAGDITWVDVYPEFQPKEFDSPDAPGSGTEMNMALVGKLYLIRKEVEKSIIITSGTRTWKRQQMLINLGLTKAKNSVHLHHAAADFRCRGLTPEELFLICEAYRFDGLGLYPEANFIHADMGLLAGVRRKPQRWTVRNGEYHYWL